MVARGLSKAKPLWRPEGGRKGGIPQVKTKEGMREAKPLWRPEGGRDGEEGGLEGGRERECLPGSLSNGEGLRRLKACRRAKASLEGGREEGREGGSDSRRKRVRRRDR